ncbi:hypothetical protein Ga0061079_1147 [Apibacter mensalis]|uniref:Uncharacterized protein n=1 Tax=Apibacter mensalis TaxID=1586267 RepID=A0A0X3ARY4_9FLAO|nr:hypothetical protein Ga0061079_1147 [Apibacter mensalis]
MKYIISKNLLKTQIVINYKIIHISMKIYDFNKFIVKNQF